MSIEDQAAHWAVRIDRGLTAIEATALDRWMESDRRCRGALLRARAAWSVLDRARALPAEAEREDEQVDRFSRRRLMVLGGGMAALLLAGVAFQLADRGDAYATGTGEIRRVALADGSLAMVNSQSQVRVRYSPGSREIELEQGEAWFQVAKNKARPFTVAAGPIRVRAVGTAFDVRRRKGISEIVVTEGVVTIWSARSGEAPFRLAANQRAVVSDRMGVQLAALTPDQSNDQLAWREGRIVLDEITLRQAATEFNRYNRVKLIVAPELADRRIVGSFHIDDIDGFVSACAVLTNARVEHGDGSITILQ
jgi:transmembrane sensor